ncbi:hypothetical protein WA158_001604 [Blastocystis sp. Blastoise]
MHTHLYTNNIIEDKFEGYGGKVSTMNNSSDPGKDFGWTFIGIAFSIEYVIRVTFNENRIQYIFSWKGLVDFIISIPMLIITLTPWETQSLMGAFTILLYHCLLNQIVTIFQSVSNNVSVSNNSLLTFGIELGSYVLCFILFFSGMFYFTEWEAYNEEHPDNPLTFLDSTYVVFITMTTTGYGDIVPRTPMGKLVMMSSVIIFGCLFGYELNKFTTILSEIKKEGKSVANMSSKGRHVILCGKLTKSIIREFLEEFYNKKYGNTNLSGVLYDYFYYYSL